MAAAEPAAVVEVVGPKTAVARASFQRGSVHKVIRPASPRNPAGGRAVSNSLTGRKQSQFEQLKAYWMDG